MITTKQMSTFNAAAEKFVVLFELGSAASEDGKLAFMNMMYAAPERIRKMLQISTQRGATLLPMEVTRPPEGKTYWDWVYSPSDIQRRFQTCKTQSQREEMALLLKDTCKASGVSASMYPVPTAAGQAVVTSEQEDAETNREIHMAQARLAVDAAIAQFGEDSQQARMAIAKAINFLPDDIKANLDAKAREMGLMPPASGYTTDGQPVFTVEAIAGHFGMDPEDVMKDVGEFGMSVDAASVHRPQ